MKTHPHRIHNGLAYRVEAQVTHHRCGSTLVLTTIWPAANHPEHVKLLTLTLPAEDLAKLGKLLQGVKP
jgi:hypothetical protein